MSDRHCLVQMAMLAAMKFHCAVVSLDRGSHQSSSAVLTAIHNGIIYFQHLVQQRVASTKQRQDCCWHSMGGIILQRSLCGFETFKGKDVQLGHSARLYRQLSLPMFWLKVRHVQDQGGLFWKAEVCLVVAQAGGRSHQVCVGSPCEGAYAVCLHQGLTAEACQIQGSLGGPEARSKGIRKPSDAETASIGRPIV